MDNYTHKGSAEGSVCLARERGHSARGRRISITFLEENKKVSCRYPSRKCCKVENLRIIASKKTVTEITIFRTKW